MNEENYEDFERGSSANWNDNSEFASPTSRNTPLIQKGFKAMRDMKNLSVSAGPFGIKS